MKSLFSVLKLQFWIGFIGTLLLSPVLYIVEILGGSIQRFGPFMSEQWGQVLPFA
ncbi:hypothetical protein [Acidovorax sp. GW101-3H11]|uniref:hypothetical protein n=1 Tax=Acidovorax sp. GW101-3H11 TaxID=1813946 RepID=UPI0012FF8737|nr:hypothetical protein [Acidovorax sp. GW101-3H11]